MSLPGTCAGISYFQHGFMRRSSTSLVFAVFLSLPASLAAEPSSVDDPVMAEIDSLWMSQIPEKKKGTGSADGQQGVDGKTGGAGQSDGSSQAGEAGQASETGAPVLLRNPSGDGDSTEQRARQIQDALGANNAANQAPEGPSLFSVVIRFAALLGAMIAVFYFVVRFLKKKSGVLGSGNELVNVIASVPLMPGKFLQIVDMAGQLMVLGVSESGVHLITRIEDGNTADRIRVWRDSNPNGQLPDNLLGRLTDMIKSSDFRFWPSEGQGGASPSGTSGNRKGSTGQRFDSLFAALQGGSSGSSEGQAIEPAGSGGQSAAGSRQGADTANADLQGRLKRQQKKIQRLRTNPEPDWEG